MKFLSVCSGIEAASVAWLPLGFEALAVSEIDKFPSAVLAHHYPTVPNLGDMTLASNWSSYEPDILVGGTPCQSFSVAGLRKGLADPRGNLMLTYLAIADRYQPEWVVWENVPGVLSSGSGRDFGTFLGALGQIGYGWAYRILDAQFFGVPQRRRRVFVIGHLGDWRPAAAVLLEREGLRGDPAPRRGSGAQVAGTLEARAGTGGYDPGAHGAASGHMIASTGNVRRLTPRECERLQGFPDDYTLIPFTHGKPAADGPRYKALGNSMAVPVMRWIGERIQLVDWLYS